MIDSSFTLQNTREFDGLEKQKKNMNMNILERGNFTMND